MSKADKEILLYTDGSSIGNPGPGGYGIIMELKGTTYKKEFSKGFRHTTTIGWNLVYYSWIGINKKRIF